MRVRIGLTAIGLLLLAGCASNDPFLRMFKRSTVAQHVKDLKSDDPEVRRKSVVALGESRERDPRIVKILCAVLEEDKEALVRAAAAEALGKVGDPSVIPSLVKALGDERYMVRWDAVKALGNLKAESAIPNIERMAKADRHSDVRQAAVNALGKIGGKEAIGPLIDIVGDKDESIAYSASQNLARLTGQSFGIHQNKWGKWWDENRDKPLPPPVGATSSGSWWARWRGTSTAKPAAPPETPPTAAAPPTEPPQAKPAEKKEPAPKESWFRRLFKRKSPPTEPKEVAPPDSRK
jgi:hypothetical protein